MTRTSIPYAIVANDGAFARALGWALRAESWRLRLMGRDAVALTRALRPRADVLIYAFDRAQIHDPKFAATETAAIGRDAASVKIFLHLASAAVHGEAREQTDRANRIIEDMARQCGAQNIAMADLMQTGVVRRMSRAGRPNAYGYLAIAHVVLRAVRARALRHTAQRGGVAEAAPPPQNALNHLVWPHPFLPASLWNGYDWESVEDFLDGRASFPTYRSWGKVAFGEPIDWGQAGANLSWQSYFNGLDFLRPPLAFWLDAANGVAKRQQGEIAEHLRARGLTPADLLARTGNIVADFVQRNPPNAPANQRAYAEGTVSRRVKVLLIYLICCRKAAELGTPADADAIAFAWQSLTHSFAMLEDDELYPAAGNHGVRQDALFMLMGVLFPALDYAQALAAFGRDRLERLQLKRALSPDGVWLENSFGYHCLVMNQLTALAADLRHGGALASDAVHAVLARMWPFAEALIKTDGFAPLIGDTAPRYVFPTLIHVRAELDRSQGNPDPAPLDLKTFERAKATYYFPDAGYFASLTSRAMTGDSSSAIFFANLSTPKHKQSDDLSVVFSRGARDLLVDGGTFNKEVSDTVRNAARFDPASHNSFRVNGAGYALRTIKALKPAGLDGMWEGEGWAAALGHNNAYPAARIARIVIHLKRYHALIVLDRLTSKGSSPVLFEQFWHLSPDLEPPVNAEGKGPWTFTSTDTGKLLLAVDQGDGEMMLHRGGQGDPIAWLMLSEEKTVPTPYFRRSLRAKEAMMASLFQSSDTARDVAVQCTPGTRGAVEITATGVGFTCKFLAGRDRVECLSLDEPVGA